MNDVLNKAEKRVELWDIGRLIPYELNAKKHPKEQVAKIVASIRNFGWKPSGAIEVDSEGVIINGHGRRLAAIELGLKKVPVVVRDDLTDVQIRAYRLADNESAHSEYDTNLLSFELKELHIDLGFDMSELFSARDLDFGTIDLGTIDDGALTQDLSAEVEAHSERTQSAIDDEKSKKVPLADVLPFKHLSAHDSRTVATFLALAKTRYGDEKPAVAFVNLINDALEVL